MTTLCVRSGARRASRALIDLTNLSKEGLRRQGGPSSRTAHGLVSELGGTGAAIVAGRLPARLVCGLARPLSDRGV